MQLLPGLGRVKVRRIRDAFEKPFQYTASTQTILATQDSMKISNEKSDHDIDNAKSVNSKHRPESPVWDIELDLNDSD